MPLPKEETTPPVTKIYLVIIFPLCLSYLKVVVIITNHKINKTSTIKLIQIILLKNYPIYNELQHTNYDLNIFFHIIYQYIHIYFFSNKSLENFSSTEIGYFPLKQAVQNSSGGKSIEESIPSKLK